MDTKNKTTKLTVSIESWIKERLNDRKKLQNHTVDSFVNDAIAEKLFRVSNRSFMDKPYGSGIIKVNTRLENWVNEKLKDKKNLNFHTKETFINEAVIEKLTRVDFLEDVKIRFDSFLSRANQLLTAAINESDFAELMRSFEQRLQSIRPAFDHVELKAIETELNFSLLEANNKLKLFYLVALGREVPRDYASLELVQNLIDLGYLEQKDDLSLSVSENALSRLND